MFKIQSRKDEIEFCVSERKEIDFLTYRHEENKEQKVS